MYAIAANTYSFSSKHTSSEMMQLKFATIVWITLVIDSLWNKHKSNGWLKMPCFWKFPPYGSCFMVSGCKPGHFWNFGCHCKTANWQQADRFPNQPACCGWLGLPKPEDVSPTATQPWARCLSWSCWKGNIFHHRWCLVWNLCWNKPR